MIISEKLSNSIELFCFSQDKQASDQLSNKKCKGFRLIFNL